RHVEFPAERGRHHRDRHAAEQVRPVALVDGVRLERQEDVEIAARPAPQARLALAGKADARAVLDARRDVDGERALARDASGARTGGARVVDDLAAAVAGRARALDGEEALRGAHAPVAAAGGALPRLGAGLGARAVAGLADNRGRQREGRGLALVGILEGNLEVVAHVGAPFAAAAGIAAAAGTGPSHEVAEQVVEDVRHGGGEVGAEAVGAVHAAALLEGGMAEAVVGRALLRVLQRLVGFVDFLEARL